MTSRHLVDPELLPLLEQFPTLAFTAEDIPNLRAMFAELPRPPIPPDALAVAMREEHVAGPAGAPEVRVLIFTPPQPAAAPRPAVLHIHAGGYVLGAPEMAEAELRKLALALDCLVVSVDYRLAPETRFPGAVEDCYAALKWLSENAAALGVDPKRIAAHGESAGGGLAAALALLARDRDGPALAFQSLIYPMLDDRTAARAEANPYLGEFFWTPQANKVGWTALLGAAPGGAEVSAYAAAARATSLAGLAPAFIIVGALDLFVEEDIEYARRLVLAGVPAELHVYPGATHAFQLATESRLAAVYARDLLDALGRGLRVR